MKKNIMNEFEDIKNIWSPRIIAEVNDVYVKLAKIKGDFDTHTHLEEDELFYVIKGEMILIYDNYQVELAEGDVHVVPKGVAHRPKTINECCVLLIENKSTKHTGEITNQYTKSVKQQQ